MNNEIETTTTDEIPVEAQPVPTIVINNTASTNTTEPSLFPKRTNHILHGVLTVLTGGLWALVWIPVAINNRNKYTR